MHIKIADTIINAEKKTPDLLKLTIPILIEAILHLMLGFVDVFMLSRYNDLAASGVNAANQVITVLSMVFLVFSSSAGILISQYLGAGQRENASRAAALTLALHLLSGLLISLVVFFFSSPMLRFIGAEDEVFKFASDYLMLVGVFLFLQSLYDAMGAIIRSHGLTKPPMLFATAMNILNTLLNLLLIPRMGVKGAALATVIGRTAGVVGMACYLFTKVEKPSVFRLLSPFPGRELRQVFKLGVPAAAETFLYHLSQLIITALVLWHLSENELIAKTYMSNIAMLFLIFSSAVGQAAQIVVGHLVGAGDFDEARRQGFRAFRLAAIISEATVLLGLIFRVPIISCFTSNPEVIRYTEMLFVIELFLELGRACNLTIIPCLRGSGDVKFPTLWAIFSNLIIGLGGAHLLAIQCHMGIHGLWIAMALDEVFRAVVMLIRWNGSQWKNKRITTQAQEEKKEPAEQAEAVLCVLRA